ncbi:hypothetical protein [Thalassococcus sp. S3]|uniref:hypothetical protein n=1 Tax=Thalassococcus sp. S3 TaxID=2017482 RepID=UPI001023F678|nr:hypothetical protein [Thalassococcus sp. S3]QBF30773.1 hypothetical protein CFI11_06020 [Thalassococcus sp. S3]
MASDTDVRLSYDPWTCWCPGIDPATDALERVSVLIRSRETWSSDYAFQLGNQIRLIANQCSPGIRTGIAMILHEHGDPDALTGWQQAEPRGLTVYALHDTTNPEDEE